VREGEEGEGEEGVDRRGELEKEERAYSCAFHDQRQRQNLTT